MHVLVQGPQVALAHVGGAPLALPAAPILLALVQEEELVRSPRKSLFLQVPLLLHHSTSFPVVLQALVDSVHSLQLSVSVC